MTKRTKIAKRSTCRKDKPDKFTHDKVLPPPVQSKNEFQKGMLKALADTGVQVVVGIGPAGCGKSLLSMAYSSDRYAKGEVDKIIITRPAVGMGNSLGMLKGDLEDKFKHYLAPLIEVYKDRYGSNKYENDLRSGAVEMAPLEYIRGRNISGICIVDEAQCTTPDELYTLITRVTETGKLIILGDPNQSDIRGESGIEWIKDFITKHNISGVSVIQATSDDIVRGGLCKSFVKAKEFDSRSKK